MQNVIPKKTSLLIGYASDAAGGAAATDIELAQNTSIRIATDLDAATTAQAAYTAEAAG